MLGFTAKAPSTLGTFLRSFRWGHVRQLDRVSRELLARVWKAGAGPGDAPFTIDLDSTICETYGLAKDARHHGYTGARGYHPLLAVAAGPGDVLMARLREGRANTARGAAHFLRETVGRVRYCGARGQTVRADSGFYTHAVCRRNVRFSIASASAPACGISSYAWNLRWTAPPMYLHPVPGRGGRRAGYEAGALFSTGSLATYSYHGFITDLELRPIIAVTPNRECDTRPQVNHLPSGRFAANGAWPVQVMAHNLARWTARIGLGQQIVTTKTLRRRVFAFGSPARHAD